MMITKLYDCNDNLLGHSAGLQIHMLWSDRSKGEENNKQTPFHIHNIFLPFNEATLQM